jgi:hypothetical protein
LEIWPSPERLEAPRLLSIVHPRETISRLGPRSWKTLTSLGALSLCAFIFAFAGEEAQAQQQHAVTDRQVAEVATEIPFRASPVEEALPQETRSVDMPPATGPVPGLPAEDGLLVEPDLPLGSALPDSDAIPGQTLQTGPVPISTHASTGHYDLESPVSEPALPELAGGDHGPRPESDSVRPNDPNPTSRTLDPETSTLAPEPSTTEDKEPLSLLAEAATAAELAPPGSGGEEGPYPLPVLGDAGTSAMKTLEETSKSPAANALETIMGEVLSRPETEAESSLYTASLANLVSGGEPERTPISEPVQTPSSTGSENPLRDAPPQPVSPFTPPAVSSFSLSGGQIGPGGVLLLLLCVLASGPILLRKDSRLSWAYFKPSKPISALRLPLERPG